ncbi:hypothetical protein BDZ91DRAFT_87629 [Kalaharituber pfeilii]|nr:hypothetical protein BDZ91DRAFT_87629 [Kalaharituber pfeilii]
MARKARQRISYVLPFANSNGHRLGVNSLAVDAAGTLYSAGRDGLICSWDLGVNLQRKATHSNDDVVPNPSTTFKTQVQAHTHWVNDIILAKNNQCVVSCSSDLTVKLWRPCSSTGEGPETIGHHSDYVKCLVSPRTGLSEWVASGGLDRKIRLWDLSGNGEILEIDVKDEGTNPKGSVYALAHGGGIIASGGPESVVRLWDPRTGKAVTKFVGHTDNIRAILVSEQGDYILSASSDTTIKLWSLTGGRCLHTLSMHNDSVWSLFSSHPRLEIFYSSDRTGLVAKTDVRNVKEIDEGLCVAVCQEKEGVRKVASCGGYIWTSTSTSNIKRWMDVDTDAEVIRSPGLGRPHASSIASARARSNTSPLASPTHPGSIPISALLRLSTTSPLPTNVRDPDAVTVYSIASARQASISEAMLEGDTGITVPVNERPEETIKGQDGLIKHFLLNDRRRVLTLDTSGNVVMWDLIRCIPINSYGKRDLEDVAAEVNTVEAVANWCQVDTRTGQLACVLEENYCFDAEMYADEVDFETDVEFKEDQRINLGRWILRCLFDKLITEVMRRDAEFRAKVEKELSEKEVIERLNAPRHLLMPPLIETAEEQEGDGEATPRATYPQTPGLAIGLATPGAGAIPNAQPTSESTSNAAEDGGEGGHPIRTSMQSTTSPTVDYFSNPVSPTPAVVGADSVPTSPVADSQSEGGASRFPKFRLGSRKSKDASSAANTANKPSATATTPANGAGDDTKPSSAESEPLAPPGAVYEDNLGGMIKRVQTAYVEEKSVPVPSKMVPCPASDAPFLTLPSNTAIIIQEDKPDSGGVADLYRGTVETVGDAVDVRLLEEKAPAWLGEVLLLNKIPFKEILKVSFVLQPWDNLLPPVGITQEGTLSRLNANRMLRARKITMYVAERLPPESLPDGVLPLSISTPTPQTQQAQPTAQSQVATPPSTASGMAPLQPQPKPEEWLELLCHGQVVKPSQTLTTIRSHVWKSGGDVVLTYRWKGWKEEKEKKERDKEKETSEGNQEKEGEEGGEKEGTAE